MKENPLFLSESFISQAETVSSGKIPEDLIDDVTTDHLIYGPHALIFDRQKMGEVLLQGFPGWKKELLQDNKFSILVSGESLGIGSSRENAAEAIKLNGIKMVFAKSFGPTFSDNLIYQGVIPSTDFDLLQDMLEDYDPSFEEKTSELSSLHKRIISQGGLPEYIRVINSAEEPLPQDSILERQPFPQTAVEKIGSYLSHELAKEKDAFSHPKPMKTGDCLVIQAYEFVGYDVFWAHASRILEDRFEGKISVDPQNIWLFSDHFVDSPDENAKLAVAQLNEFWKQHPQSFHGSRGVYNKVMPLHLPPGSVVVGMDSHTPELAVVPGVLPIPIGYTAFASAIANRGLVPYVIPETISLKLDGDLPEYTDIKDAIWNLTGSYFSQDLGNGKLFEISGGGYRALPFTEAAKIFNAVTEWGGKGAIGVEFNSQIADYLKHYGRNLIQTDTEDIERIFASLRPDEGAEYDTQIRFDLGDTIPAIVGPHKHKLVKPVDKLSQPLVFDRIIYNSCAGSTILDLEILSQVLGEKSAATHVDVHLADPLTRIQAQRLGTLERLAQAGVNVDHRHSCGPCMGQGASVQKGERVLATSNRNYPGRMGHPESEVYLSSSSVAAVVAKLGRAPNLRELQSFGRKITEAKERVYQALEP